MGDEVRRRPVQRNVRRGDSADKAAGSSHGKHGHPDPISWAVDTDRVRLGLGNSSEYLGDADLVFSHLYGPLPKQLIGKPAIINVFGNKREAAQQWAGAELVEVSKWGKGLTNTIYVANMAAGAAALQCVDEGAPPDLTDLVEDEFEPGRGWFPEELCRRLLRHQGGGLLPVTVFDGFMGRATVGKVAIELGLKFIGIDINPERVEIARQYLEV